jgi:hypothetical protein
LNDGNQAQRDQKKKRKSRGQGVDVLAVIAAECVADAMMSVAVTSPSFPHDLTQTDAQKSMLFGARETYRMLVTPSNLKPSNMNSFIQYMRSALQQNFGDKDCA